MNYKLYAVRIFVENLTTAIDFYEKTLEMKLAYRDDEVGWAQMEIGNNIFLGLERVKSTDNEFEELVGRFVGVSLQVDNIQHTYESFKAKKVEFVGEPQKQSWGGTIAHFKDIDGNVLTILGQITNGHGRSRNVTQQRV